MAEKLTPLALDILLPETEGGPTPLFVALGEAPRQAVIAWVLNSRRQVVDTLKKVEGQLDEGVAQGIIQATNQIESVPADSELPVDTFEGGVAQIAFNNAHPAVEFEKLKFGTGGDNTADCVMDLSGQPMSQEDYDD